MNYFENSRKKQKPYNPPPLYDTFPTSIKERVDPKTNVNLPRIDAVKDVKRWSEENTK